MPHSSSGYRSGSGQSVGSASIVQPSTPLRDRGTQMRMAASILDPAEEQGRAVLKSSRPGVEDGVLGGQSAAVRMGLASCRWKRVS